MVRYWYRLLSCCRQLMLKDFGNLGVMKFNPPVSVKDLALLGEH